MNKNMVYTELKRGIKDLYETKKIPVEFFNNFMLILYNELKEENKDLEAMSLILTFLSIYNDILQYQNAELTDNKLTLLNNIQGTINPENAKMIIKQFLTDRDIETL